MNSVRDIWQCKFWFMILWKYLMYDQKVFSILHGASSLVAIDYASQTRLGCVICPECDQNEATRRELNGRYLSISFRDQCLSKSFRDQCLSKRFTDKCMSIPFRGHCPSVSFRDQSISFRDQCDTVYPNHLGTSVCLNHSEKSTCLNDSETSVWLSDSKLFRDQCLSGWLTDKYLSK